MLVYVDEDRSPLSNGQDTLSPDSVYLSSASPGAAPRPGEGSGLQRVSSADALLSNPAALRRRVVRLEERLRRREVEARELRKIVAAKDVVIRDLGSSCEISQAAEHALQTKDDIIRSLGASQSQVEGAWHAVETKDAIIRQLAGRSSQHDVVLSGGSVETLPCSDWTEGRPARQASNPTSAVPFSVAPVSQGDAVYHPVPDSDVDCRIAQFSNSRKLKILFTRIDEHNNYIYGRLPVHCMVDDDGMSEVGVKVATEGLLTDEVLFPLEEFVSMFEDAEYQRCTLELERAGWLQGWCRALDPEHVAVR